MRKFSAQEKRLSLEVHQLSHESHPATLEQLGLVAARRGFCEEFALVHELAIEFTGRSLLRLANNFLERKRVNNKTNKRCECSSSSMKILRSPASALDCTAWRCGRR
jgi:hypothetical protein